MIPPKNAETSINLGPFDTNAFPQRKCEFDFLTSHPNCLAARKSVGSDDLATLR